MINFLIAGVLASAILPTAYPTHQSVSPAVQFSRVMPESLLSGHIVQPGESLTSIANLQYGAEDFWTTLWNDNDWIENPELIEANQLLKLKEGGSDEPEALKPELQARLDQASKDAILAVKQEKIAPVPTVQVVENVVAEIPVKAPIANTNSPQSLTMDQITYLGNCEAGMDPAKNTGNGYYGAFQFSYGTWKSMGTGYERADLAPIEVQIDAVQRLLQRSSIFTQFPGCARKMEAQGII